MKMMRPLFCPICGTRVKVPVEAGKLPEIHRLPEHPSGNGANLCAGLVVTVVITYDRCGKCKRKMPKHPSGVCMDCYEPENNNAPISGGVAGEPR